MNEEKGHLFFDRRIGESFVIGDNVSVKVLSIDSGGRVRLGINAPKDVKVVREELLENGK